MTFSEFANKLGAVIRGADSTDKFAKTLFSVIVTEEGQEIVNKGYSESSYKGFFNGHITINRIAKRISTYVEPMNFIEFIEGYSDPVVDNICLQFSDEIPGINPRNAGYELGQLLVHIIIEAAGKTKKVARKSDIESEREKEGLDGEALVIEPEKAIAPDLSVYQDGVLYLEGIKGQGSVREQNPFFKYLESASKYHSDVKTVIFDSRPCPFDELFICSDIVQRRSNYTDFLWQEPINRIKDATIQKLRSEGEYIIIEGTGGIGKSMMLRHLFFSSAKVTNAESNVPILTLLKDYKDDTAGLVEFIWKEIQTFDSSISLKQVIEALENKRLVILLDGLDEIPIALRNSFDKDLEAFMKSYPGNMIIMSSRPVSSFSVYAKFFVFDIAPFTKEQALALIEKINFWDKESKRNFKAALNKGLYYTHHQFASNPLLLTIMLMTYSSFGEIPRKMHVFYKMAYNTMARLHDNTKGSYQRPLYTQLTPEEFSKYFAEFCARTYREEIFEFTDYTFNSYMGKVLKDTQAQKDGVTARDFQLDLIDNLCLMYREGEKCFFIHRSFQEYFAADHFASMYDNKLVRVGKFFEKTQDRMYSDRTFEMLFDMIPEKVERYIFLPFLEESFEKWNRKGEAEEYWEYMEDQYPFLYYIEGEIGTELENKAKSFLYRAIIKEKKLWPVIEWEGVNWPKQIYKLPTEKWSEVYSDFLEESAFEKYESPDLIEEEKLWKRALVPIDELPYRYSEFFGKPESDGIAIEIDVHDLRKYPQRYIELRGFMESIYFPLVQEFSNIKQYYREIAEKKKRDEESDDLFDE